MYSSLVGGNVLKVQAQNHYEKVRCDLYIKDIAKRHAQSLTNIHRSIREARDTLRDIQASSGYCKKVQGSETASKSNVWKERELKSQTDDGNLGKRETQARWKTSAFQELKSKNSDSGQQTVSKRTVNGGKRGSLLHEESEGNIIGNMEYIIHGKNGGGNASYEMNGDRSDIVPAERLLRDEILMRPDSRNVSGRIRGTNRQGMDSHHNGRDSDFKEPQGKSQGKSTSSANGGNFQNTDTKSTKRFGSVTSSTDEPPESDKSRPNNGSDGLMGRRSRTAPAKAPPVKSQVKPALASESKLKKNSRSRYLSASDVKKVEIHMSLSRMERKRILQELISSCTVPCDRTVLERERQRRLHQKIHRFFELLFEQDDKDVKDDESDIFGDD